MCRFCPSGIASGTTQTAARTAAPRYEPKSRQNNQSGFVPLAEDCGSSSLREERPRWKRDSGASINACFRNQRLTQIRPLQQSRLPAGDPSGFWDN